MGFNTNQVLCLMAALRFQYGGWSRNSPRMIVLKAGLMLAASALWLSGCASTVFSVFLPNRNYTALEVTVLNTLTGNEEAIRVDLSDGAASSVPRDIL